MRIFLNIIGLLGLFVLVGSTPINKINSPGNSLLFFTESLPFEPNQVYLILRGSDTKLSGFAKRYNNAHPKASHVALAIYTDSLRIYHVNTTDSRRDNLLMQSLDEFSYHPKGKHTYFGAWKLKNVSPTDLQLMQEKISYFKTKDVRFDYRFDFKSDQKLYCSEFIYKVLTHTQNSNFKLPLTTKVVPKEHRFFLKTDTLTFYPTDFFLALKSLEFVGEWHSDSP